MYFITVDSNNLVMGIYDGSKDYVHRITGEPMPGAFRIPDEAIQITQEDVDFFYSKTFPWQVCWDGSACVDNPATPRDVTEAAILNKELQEFAETRRLELDVMPVEDLNVLATTKGV